MQSKQSNISPNRYQRGFTLIELIMVIILLSVIGMLGGNFIAESFKGFSQSDSRMKIYEEGKTALVRMEREIHNAIPNAVNLLSGPPQKLQFGIISEVDMRNVFGRYTDNPPTSTLTDPLTPNPFDPTGLFISVYNRNWNDFTVLGNQRRLYTVNNYIYAAPVLTMNLNPGPKKITPPRSSPQKRYYFVNRVVQYYREAATDTLMRSQITINNDNDDLITNLTTSTDYPLARNVTNLVFSYTPASLTRNAIVTINFTIQKNNESVSFHKEVHIKNVP